MALFGEETVIVIRESEGSFNDEGEFIPSDEPITFTTPLVINPLTGLAADRIQDDNLKSKNLKGMVEIMSETFQLLTKDSAPTRKADRFMRNTKMYEVDSMLWIGGGLPHWEGTAQLIKDGN